jgi:very-short-patch-repair endonuclease
MSLPEVVLWNNLRKGRLEPLRFRRQHPVGPYILDFYCSSAKLAVEVDSDHHGHPDQNRHDRVRDAWLRERGVRVLRVSAPSVLDDDELWGVLAEIEAAAAPSTPSGSPTPVNGGGADLPSSNGGPTHG